MAFHFPWLAAAILCPLAGAVWVFRLQDPDLARRRSLIACGLALLLSIAAGVEFAVYRGGETVEAHDAWDTLDRLTENGPALVVDALNAPLLPLAALLYLLTLLATLRIKVQRFSFARLLISLSLLLATFACKQPWGIVVLLALGTIPPWIELRRQGKPTLVYTLHMALFVVLLVAGQALIARSGGGRPPAFAVIMLAAAVLVRSGIAPVHCWMPHLFEHAASGTALLFVTPMLGAFAAMRLLLPVAPYWVLHGMAVAALITVVYAAGMALVQRDARRFFCYLFLSHSSLVLVGLGTATSIGLTGALCLWLSVGLSLAGFGLTLRSIEFRTGRLSLEQFHGLYAYTPRMAALFLLTGLASIGFPGTVGFVGAELLMEGAIKMHPLVGIAIVVGAALNGLAVLHAYFRVFTGTRHATSIDLRSRGPERISVLVFAALILGGGLYPQPGVVSRYDAAVQLVERRTKTLGLPAANGESDTAKADPENDINRDRTSGDQLNGQISAAVPRISGSSDKRLAER